MQYSASKSGAYIVIRLGGFFLVRFFFPLPAPIPNKHQVESKFTSKVLIRSLFIKKVTVGEWVCKCLLFVGARGKPGRNPGNQESAAAPVAGVYSHEQ